MNAGVRKIGRGGLPTGKLCIKLRGAIPISAAIILRRFDRGMAFVPRDKRLMALLPIFCVARFSRTDLSMIGARVLKSVELPTGGMPPTYETMH